MDIKARIEEVIAQRGLTKREVSERMGKFNQAFNSLITNPKWDTIELVAHAIGIPTKELLFDSTDASSQSQNSDETELCTPESQTNKTQTTIGMLVCPHCGKGITLNIKKI